MSDRNWMFGGSSDPSLLKDPPRKQGLYDRTLPAGYTSGGFNIGDNDESGQSSSRKAATAAYRASLDNDKVCYVIVVREISLSMGPISSRPLTPSFLCCSFMILSLYEFAWSVLLSPQILDQQYP